MSIDTRAQRAADGVHASARGVDPMSQIVDLKREVKTRQRTGLVVTAAVVLAVVLGAHSRVLPVLSQIEPDRPCGVSLVS